MSRSERRRRQAAEQQATDLLGAEARPLTRRELRARDEALATGELELDSTGELRIRSLPVSEPVPPTAAAPTEPPPVTGSIGMTRRQMRDLQPGPEADSVSAASAVTPPRGLAPQPPAVAAAPVAAEPTAAESGNTDAVTDLPPATVWQAQTATPTWVSPHAAPTPGPLTWPPIAIGSQPQDGWSSDLGADSPGLAAATGAPDDSAAAVAAVVEAPSETSVATPDESGAPVWMPTALSRSGGDVQPSLGAPVPPAVSVPVAEPAPELSMPPSFGQPTDVAMPRRPVVRPPSTAAIRSLDETDTSLGPVVAPGATSAPASDSLAAAWSTSQIPAVDVTAAAIPADPVAAAPAPDATATLPPLGAPPVDAPAGATPAVATPPVQAPPGAAALESGSAIDFATQADEPNEPFVVRPQWPTLPTDPAAAAAMAAPPVEQAAPATPTFAAPDALAAPVTAPSDIHIDDDDDDDDDDHRTPVWLVVLMFVVLAVIFLALGLLVYRAVTGDSNAAAAAATLGAVTSNWEGLR